jgi:hypothetical protein
MNPSTGRATGSHGCTKLAPNRAGARKEAPQTEFSRCQSNSPPAQRLGYNLGYLSYIISVLQVLVSARGVFRLGE